MTDEQFYELSERLRGIESRLFGLQESPTMMIEALKTKLAAFFDKAYANHGNKWVREVIAQVKSLILSRLDSVKVQMEAFFDSEQFDGGVDFLIAFARGNVSIVVPWYLRLFVPSTDKLLGDLGTWLKANKSMFKEQIGTMPPV